MEDISIKSCSICKETMIDPKILPCHHSFCLKCLESSTISIESPKCPTCQIEFQIPQDGLKDLKKNEFIEKVINVKQSNINCDSCKENEAINYCVECSFNYCSTCLLYHGRSPVSINHHLQSVTPANNNQVINKYSSCKDHQEFKTLFCKDCNIDSCDRCFSLKHNTHKMEHIQDYFSSVTNKLKDNLKLKARISQSIISNYKHSESVMHNNELEASKLKKEIQQRGDDLKKQIDSIVDELIKAVDKILCQHKKESGVVMLKLKNMETNLNAEIETLQQQLNKLNFENVVETSFSIVERKENIPNYNRTFNVSLSYDVTKQNILKQIFGHFIKAPKLRLIKTRILNPEKSCSYTESFASTQSWLFVCHSNSLMWSNNQQLNFKTYYNFGKDLSNVTDLLVVNNCLYVSGYMLPSLNFNDRSFHIFKFDLAGTHSLFYRCQYDKPNSNVCLYSVNMRLSKSYLATLLLILLNKIIHFSEHGKIMKTINMPFKILDALQLHEKLYAICCDSELCLVNDFGVKMVRYFSDLDVRNITSPCSLAKDGFGNIYVISSKYKNGKIFVLDEALNFRSSLDIDDVSKMCYDESNDTLLVLKNKCTLLTFEL